MPFDGCLQLYEAPTEPRWLFRKDKGVAQRERKRIARESVIALDMLLELFDDGKHWMRNNDLDGYGNYCLRGGLTHVRIQRGVRDKAGIYLSKAIRIMMGRSGRLTTFNDDCVGYARVRLVILCARMMALKVLQEDSDAAS